MDKKTMNRVKVTDRRFYPYSLYCYKEETIMGKKTGKIKKLARNTKSVFFENQPKVSIPIDQIEINPVNEEYFGNLSYASSTMLEEDIRTTGLKYPLLVTKRDKKFLLVGGHRRLLVMQKLDYKNCDCVVSKGFMTDAEMRLAMIMDNAARRQLPNNRIKLLREERLKLYKQIIPGFSIRLLETTKGIQSGKGLGITAKMLSAKTKGIVPVHVAAKDLRNEKLRKKKDLEKRKIERGISSGKIPDNRLIGSLKSNMTRYIYQAETTTIVTVKQMIKDTDDFTIKLKSVLRYKKSEIRMTKAV